MSSPGGTLSLTDGRPLLCCLDQPGTARDEWLVAYTVARLSHISVAKSLFDTKVAKSLFDTKVAEFLFDTEVAKSFFDADVAKPLFDTNVAIILIQMLPNS